MTTKSADPILEQALAETERHNKWAQRAIRLRLYPFAGEKLVRSEEDRRRAPALAREAVGRAWSDVLRLRHAGVAWSVEDE